jgi:hypothetical protein
LDPTPDCYSETNGNGAIINNAGNKTKKRKKKKLSILHFNSIRDADTNGVYDEFGTNVDIQNNENDAL